MIFHHFGMLAIQQTTIAIFKSMPIGIKTKEFHYYQSKLQHIITVKKHLFQEIIMNTISK